jgi:hypothetical protein
MSESQKASGEVEPPDAPEWLKSILWICHHARVHWDTLVKPPVIVVILVVAALGFLGGRMSRTDQHDIDQQRISFLQDQITAYKDRLQGATPDEAAKKFSTLEGALALANSKISRFFPDKKRHLTDADKVFIRSHATEIRKAAPLQIDVFGMSFGDSLRYAQDFLDEFKANGISAVGPIPSPCEDNQNGVLVGMKDPSKPSENSLRFISLLTEMGMHPAPTHWFDAPDESSFDLFICGEAIDPPTSPLPSPTTPR